MVFNSKQKRIFFIAFFIGVVLLLSLESWIQIRGNRRQAEEAANLLIGQVSEIIQNNTKEEKALTETLKESYITRAESVAYILDHQSTPASEAELDEIAKLQRVDEIHIFDTSGTIVMGTEPKYYGYNFDSGKQMNYFKKMLTDKKLTMCQDVTPNTAEGKPMMYAICWNATGTMMVQVGIEPVRLLGELQANEISEVVANMPSYDGTTIIVATKKGKILGATETAFKGKRISAIGLGKAKSGRFTAKVNGAWSYCDAKTCGRYRIAVVQKVKTINADVPRTVLIIAAYLALAGICMGLLLKRLSQRVREEHREAITDAMTGFLNRRAYAEAETLLKPDITRDMTYVYVDINGLKHANDTLGHDAGDELIAAAAACMREAFDAYTKLYRVGGDEFIAVVDAPPDRAKAMVDDFLARTAAWHGRFNDALSVSCGSAYRGELEDASLGALQKKAEARMYEMKQQYYKENGGADRRRT